MNRRDIEDAIKREVEEWPGVTVEFVAGGKHPKAKLSYQPPEGSPLFLHRSYPSTPGTVGIRSILGDIRRTMKQLGAARAKAEPSAEEDEAPYAKPNPGRERRPDPVVREPATLKLDMGEQLVAAGAATPAQAEKARAKPLIEWAEDQPAAEPAANDNDRGAIERMIETLRGCGIELPGLGDEPTMSAVIRAAADTIEDGVYFGLPFEVYKAVNRLSGSGLQDLCVSPATFWNRSWMNPDRPGLDEEETKAQMVGKAYHLARLEPERFESVYARKPTKADYAGQKLLTSDAAVKAELKALGMTQSIGTETVPERCQRLVEAGYEGPIFPLITADFEAQLNGRIALDATVFDQIAIDLERIRKNDEIAELLSGGQAEVSIFWTDTRYGLKMKARPDYLTPEWWDDFKTFDNSRGKELEQACADSVRYNRYHVQAVTYRDAIEALRLGGLKVKATATDAQHKLVAEIQLRSHELSCWYIFQEKGGVPNLLAFDFNFYVVPITTVLNSAGASPEAIARAEEATRTKSGLHIRAIQDIDKAKRDFILYSQVYPEGEPWSPIEARRRLTDQHFSRYWLGGDQG